jgi:two-component system nitrogen regulation sensor histidine kinase NtrY
MRMSRYRLFLIILTVVMFLMALASELLFFSDFEYRFRTKMFNKTLRAKERILGECLNAMKPIMASDHHHGSVIENNLFTIAEQNEITILEYFDNKLFNWSDNGFSVPQHLNDSLYSKPLIYLQNGWFLPKTIQTRNEKIVGLLRVHTDYGFENKLIKSGFEKDFRMPANVGFTTDRNSSEYHIFNTAGDFLFSLSFPQIKGRSFFMLIPLSLWAIEFVLIILFSFEMVKFLVGRGKKLSAAVFIILIFSLIYCLILFLKWPSVLFQTELFSKYGFSLFSFIPSLGHLVVFSILSACLAYIIYYLFPFMEKKSGETTKDYLLVSVLLIIVVFIFICCNHIFTILVLNTSISFQVYKVLELNVFSVVGFTTIILLMLVPVLFLLKIFKVLKQFRPKIIIYSIIFSLLVPAAYYYNDPNMLLPFLIFYILITISLWFTITKKIGIFNLSVIFSLIFGVYSLYILTMLSEKKVTEKLKIQAVTFSTENDPEAESLLLDLWPVLKNDTTLAEMMKVDYFEKDDFDRISTYLQQTYLTGYWRNFNSIIIPCLEDQHLQIDPVNGVTKNCFSFFEERIRRDGHLLTGTDFYFIDNQGGRSYYIGKLFFKSRNGITKGLFIELYSDINVFQPGYSELLLDKKYHGYAGLKDYAFAKYINGKIVLRNGDFPYDETDAAYVEESPDYKFFKSEGFNHILYRNGNATVLISRPGITSGDIIISFAYLFAAILLFFSILLLIVRRPELRNTLNLNFRQKLQLSFIGVLLFSFLSVGGVVTSYTIKQYQSKHTENLKEKLNSVYLELESKISIDKQLMNDWRRGDYASLNDLLIRLSNIFKADINLYDLYGFLIATSRPEIFFRDLTSSRINNMALINLADLKKSEYYQKEKIGSLEYISAYVPFFNSGNEVTAYLNLPYFRMQSVLSKEISNLIVAVINLTLLLILITMSLAVFISGRLTSPLTMLGEGLASVGVGKKSEHLSYKGNDEIGILVRQYNRMVDEIEESTHKLANSEREYAWREMAKQIAHEIKNPLTPMKLNVQQLLKSWNDKVPGFEKKLERFTFNQIEYIDNLSSIASAFSSFAKLPGTNPMEVNLLSQIKTTLELFKNTDNIIFHVHWPIKSKILIYADKEHLNGIFSNLFKNGIQSIPPEREGLISINFDLSIDKVVVAISDNGTGIPEELKGKLFTPNFTTKSSGMGLGLSIVKKYIEGANGRIWFESEPEEGSVFYVELPIFNTVGNQE